MWLVVSRVGAQSSLNAFDFAAIRYGVSAIASLPIILYYKPWRNMSLYRIIGLSVLLGPVYILCVYFAFDYAPAAHGGIFLFVIAAVFFSTYLIVAKAWSVTPTQVMLCSSIVNAVLFIPVWYFWLPTGLGEVLPAQLYLQLFYQGLIPGMLGLILVAYATRTIGPASTSAFIAAVPGLGMLLGIAFLEEIPGWIGWLGLFVLTPGILLVSLGGKRRVLKAAV